MQAGGATKPNNRLQYGPGSFQESCATRGTPVAGAVTVTFNGSVHYDPGATVTVSAVPEGSLRGAAVLSLERQGHEAGSAPTAGVVEPRADRAEAYREAREEQQKLYDALT